MSDRESQGRTCPECGSPVGDRDKFCIACGHKLDAQADGMSAPEPVAVPALVDTAYENEDGLSEPPADEPAQPIADSPVNEGVVSDHSNDPVVVADWSTDSTPDSAGGTSDEATDEAPSDEGPGEDTENEWSPESEAALTTVMHPSDFEYEADGGPESEAALTTVLDTSEAPDSEGEDTGDDRESEGETSDESGEAGTGEKEEATKEETEKSEAEKALKRRRAIIIGIIIGGAALAIGGIIAAWYFIGRRSAPVSVPITVSADGYSTDCTSIPVQITSVSQGRRVETETVFVRGGTSKISLPPGSYTLSFPASPLTPSGILYETPREPITLNVNPDNGADAAVTGNDQEAVFTLSTALDETDEMIQDAYEWAIKDPSQADRAVELRDMAVMVHESAVAEQEQEEQRAEEERLRQEEEQQRQLEEQQRQEEEQQRQLEEQQRQQEEQQALANAINSIQGTWASSVQGGVENLVIVNDQATFQLIADDGNNDQAGPYKVVVASTTTTSQYNFDVTAATDAGEETVARLNYSPSNPNTLTGYIIGTGGDTIVTYTKA